ncbi:unnamed protein product [Adineta steineri]|uniref:Uncharacterized protein n=1 Tax=Adineta steineri TaxID=433720 RepID=A0A819EHF7_9BILA|nr:unnamed protein product [Adineta steineri]
MRETEQMKLLYETLNKAALANSHQFYQYGNPDIPRLEPRRSNPLDRYQLPEEQWQIPSSKPDPSDYHKSIVQDVYNQTYHEEREQNGNKQHNSDVHRTISNEDESSAQYLQVDPRCYVRQNSNNSLSTQRRSETPRLEKGYTINIDTRPSPTASLSPYRQSSFDVTSAYYSPNNQPSTPTCMLSTQQDIFFTPRGSSLSVVGNPSTNTPPGSQHLSPPPPVINKKNSPIEKKDITVQMNPSTQTSKILSSISQRERSTSINNSSVDKQSRSFDAANLLRPVIHRADAAINRRAKSYECAEDYHPSSPVAPPPIIIKIPDMNELVQAAKLDEYRQNSIRKNKHNHQIVINNEHKPSKDFWRQHQSCEIDDQQHLDRTSPEEFSTSIDSVGAMTNHHPHTSRKVKNDDLSNYHSRRKSSSNLLLPPPEVRRQALRRTYEKRRNCVNQSNARREQQLLNNNNQNYVDDDYNTSTNQSSTLKSTDFSSLVNNLNSKSENSSFDRSLETDFDMQSDTSSRGQNDQFTSIESSGNEYAQPDINRRLLTRPPSEQQQQQQQIPHKHDSGFKSLESQNNTISLDWMSADGGETVIYMGDSLQQRTVDFNDDPSEQQISNNHRFNSNNRETTSTLHLSTQSNPNKIQHRSLSTNIPVDDHHTTSESTDLFLSPSFHRTASKKRREFRKEKSNLTSSVVLPHIITTTDDHDDNTKLKVRQMDFRRSKSDEVEILESFGKSFKLQSNNSTHLSSSNDGSLKSTSSNTTVHARPIFQKSPSVNVNSSSEAFRTKRGSMSFDNPSPMVNTSQANTKKSSTIGIKPRLKFSMVRDTTTSSLGSNSSSLLNDFSIDEKTNRIINEYLMQDDNKTTHTANDFDNESHHEIEENILNEPIINNNNSIQKQARAAFIKQRPHSFIQTNTRPHVPLRYPSLHLPDSVEQDEDRNDSRSYPPTFIQQSVKIVSSNNGLANGSPSIIVTGYDSSS